MSAGNATIALLPSPLALGEPLSTARTRLIAVIAAFAIAGLTAGCGEDPPSRAGTVQTDNSEGTDDATPDPALEETEEPVADDAAGRELTVKQARAALPTVATLPSGWSADTENVLFGDDEDDDSDDTTTPAHCAQIFDAIGSDEKDPTAKAAANFTSGGFGPWFGVEISSFEDEVDDEMFEKVLDALGKCPEFTVDSHDGEGPATYQVSPLSIANVGEETAAFRLNVESGGMAMLMDFAIVRNGHNTITGATAGLGSGMPATEMEKQLRLTMKRLTAS